MAGAVPPIDEPDTAAVVTREPELPYEAAVSVLEGLRTAGYVNVSLAPQ